jgi:RNA polymerase sigma-70 factor, ECF subfamily
MALTPLDRDLVTRCVAGESLAWQQFVDRYLGLIHQAIRHTAHARSLALTATEVDDLAADVLGCFVDHKYRVFRRFRGEASLATYVAVIVRRWTVNHLARRAAMQRRSEAPPRGRVADPAGPALDDREEVEDLVRRLPAKSAALVRGHYLQGLSYEELAAVHNVPINSIGPTLTRALAKLRRARAG